MAIPLFLKIEFAMEPLFIQVDSNLCGTAYNGLLLIPNLDICFDLGLISFDDEGKILISNALNQSTLLLFGINSNLKLLRIGQRHKGFLKYHRENVFRD